MSFSYADAFSGVSCAENGLFCRYFLTLSISMISLCASVHHSDATRCISDLKPSKFIFDLTDEQFEIVNLFDEINKEYLTF